MRQFYAACLVALALAGPAAAQAQKPLNDTIDVDKSHYTLFNPTPRKYMRPMVPDRPGITESPYSIHAGHVQYEADALRLANDTQYGLASGVFTQNLGRAHRMIRGIRAGIVWVNTYRAVSPIAPFGGHGLSGHGREGGLAAALDYTTVKTVWLRTSDDPIPDPFVMR